MFTIHDIPCRALPTRYVLRRATPKEKSGKMTESSSHREPSSSGSSPPRRTSHTKPAQSAPAASVSSQGTFDPFGFDNNTPQSAPSHSQKTADPFGESFAAFPPTSNGTAGNSSAFSNDVWGAPAEASTTRDRKSKRLNSNH